MAGKQVATSPRRARTWFSVIRGALGVVELVLPAVTARWWGGRWRLDRRRARVVRVLGGRQLGQALMTYLVPDAAMAATGAVVDGIHALSMVALAMLSRRWRRAAAAEAFVAAGLAGVGVSLARSLPDRRAAP